MRPAIARFNRHPPASLVGPSVTYGLLTETDWALLRTRVFLPASAEPTLS